MRLAAIFCGLTLLLASPSAFAADAKSLQALRAPAPTVLRPLAPGAQPAVIKLARIVVQLPPEPWAWVVVKEWREGDISEELATWKDGQVDVEPSTVSTLFAEEMQAAGISVDGVSDSLFAKETTADLLVGVRITRMQGRFCRSCRYLQSDKLWEGAVVMDARWEVYSSLDRKVVASIDTSGGFEAPKKGLAGEPDRLVHEALRDNIRGLINSEPFRLAVTTPVQGASHQVTSSQDAFERIIFRPAAPAKRTLPDATRSVAAIFSGEGHGSGFLVSGDGLLLTNRHVVGAAKFVKVKWADGAEAVGEVVRSDRRRDVALVKVSHGERQPLALRAATPTTGATVFAVGTPLDEKFQGTVTRGIVSATRTFEGQPYIQSDVVVNGGNSGGPLLDEEGAVIGICVSGIDINGAPAGINLFIPIDDALKALALTPAS